MVPCKVGVLIGVFKKVFPGNLGERAFHADPCEGGAEDTDGSMLSSLQKQSSPEGLREPRWRTLSRARVGWPGSVPSELNNAVVLLGGDGGFQLIALEIPVCLLLAEVDSEMRGR